MPRESWATFHSPAESGFCCAAPTESAHPAIEVDNLSFSYFSRKVLDGINIVVPKGVICGLLGPNGSGKTTLLRLITGQLTPVSGTVRLGSNVHLGYLSQEQETLAQYTSPLDAIMRSSALSETNARTYLHQFLFAGDEVHTPMASLSFGQRSRLNLGLLVLQGCNLLLLDEPINHLDIPSRETFEQALASFDGTVLAVVHDRYFIERFATSVWALRDGTIARYPDLRQALAGTDRLWSLDESLPASPEPPALT